MPIIQPPPAPPKKVTITVRLEEHKLFELRRYGAFLGTRNHSHIISESLTRIFRMDSEYNTWLKEHPDFQLERKARSNGSRQGQGAAISGASAPSIVAAEAAGSTEV
jgi:hypothetical protein